MRRKLESDTGRLVDRRLYWSAFSFRAAVGLAAYLVDQLTDARILEDAAFYEEVGYAVAQEWLAGRSVDFQTLAQGAQTASLLVVALAGFHYATGGIRAIPILLVAYASVTALVPFYVRRIALELGAPQAVARRAAWLVTLSPAFVFWSGSLYKEGITLLALSLAAYYTLKLQARWRGRSAVLLTLCGLVLWGVRYYLAIILSVAAALALLWGRRLEPENRRPALTGLNVRRAILASAFLVLVLVVALAERTERLLFVTEQEILVDLDGRRSWSAQAAASGYLPEASIDTHGEAVQYLPLGLLHFLTVPLPWQGGALRQYLVVPETLFWLLLYPLIVLGVIRAVKVNPPGTVFLLMITVGMCLVYALLVANVGTAYRMRTQVWLLWAPFAAWGWEIWRSGRRQMPMLVRRSAPRMTPGAARVLRRIADRAR
jgi:hypothetical protein